MSDQRLDSEQLKAIRDAVPIRAFSVWRFYLGGLYRVYGRTHLVSDPETIMIQHQLKDADPFDPMWSRPASEWLELVEHEGGMVPRFTEETQ